MTVDLTHDTESRSRWLLRAAWVALPLLAAGYQYFAKEAALSLAGLAADASTLWTLLQTPAVAGLILCDAFSLAAWMTVLSHVKLSEAFPMSAISYVAVIALSWFVFHEQGSPLQVTGSVLILIGVWLMSRDNRGKL